VSIRPATEQDHDILRELWEELAAELDDPYPDDENWEQAWPDVRRTIESGAGFVADRAGRVVGFVLTTLGRRDRPFAHVTDMYVRPDARRAGVAKELLAAVVEAARERDLPHVSLDVSLHNTTARTVYDRLGFRPISQWMVTDTDVLAGRLGRVGAPPSFASTHVQTDDEAAVERALAQFMPRLGHSARTEVAPARNGWVAVIDELCDRDRSAQRRVASELSERMGVPVVALALEEEAVVRFMLFDRGRMVDEYLSVPTYYGELNKADELSLAANATLVARLTGADPARVRAVARTAASAGELPPARELLEQIATVMNLEARIDR
jgi:ribosomal protein S18 acetylase RimI-like enzyme